ncbi:HAD family hydrolase [Undibacterium sp. TS12]|uniref:HAD family hydrolase n=1 Tax=Undibacterium sp. TS12 TaxID=2908202 RepID=UPI001F4C9BCA|nr:HAD family hydrolase [Undibacterium sp. TS12]MCH8622792.1 HAD family hydrolase [Undibacterium sp. TS12]
MQRRLVVFDLDETLVHATEHALSRPAEFEITPYLIYQRPFVADMLAELATDFDLAVWSSSSQVYVDAIVSRIFRHPLKFAWSVKRCIQRVDVRTNSYVYIKDLRKIRGYTLEHIIMVDDSPEKIARQPRNHLHISPYLGQADDNVLLALPQRLHSFKPY